jgi:acetyltransferase
MRMTAIASHVAEANEDSHVPPSVTLAALLPGHVAQTRFMSPWPPATTRGPRHSGPVLVRPVCSTDALELERFYRGLSVEGRQTRFLSFSPGLSHAQSVSFCTTDHEGREGFVAVLDRRPGGGQRIVGHLCLEPAGRNTAEVALTVTDEFQHQGIGRRLMAAGTAWARREQLERLTATMLVGNAPIHRLLIGLGLPTQSRCLGSGIAEIMIDLVPHGGAAA